MHSCLSMNLFATFAFLLPGHPTLSTTFDYLKQRKKTAEKIDTNAQWFHCSWSILLKRVNIRVRGFCPRKSHEKIQASLFFPSNLDAFFCSNQKKILEIPSIKTWMGPNPNGPRSGSCFLELLDTQVEFRGPFSKSCLRFLKFQQQKITQTQVSTQGSTSSGEKIEVLGLKNGLLGRIFICHKRNRGWCHVKDGVLKRNHVCQHMFFFLNRLKTLMILKLVQF